MTGSGSLVDSLAGPPNLSTALLDKLYWHRIINHKHLKIIRSILGQINFDDTVHCHCTVCVQEY